jgi:hypothetical protein
LTFLYQELMVFECAMFDAGNPFPDLAEPERYVRQCPYATVMRIPTDDHVEISRAYPLFPDDSGIIASDSSSSSDLPNTFHFDD